MDLGSLFTTTLQGGLGNLAAYLAAHVLLCLAAFVAALALVLWLADRRAPREHAPEMHGA
ncbi:MAG TPA: hypothetical protein VIJ43_15805 [Burkholderiales bacterium]